MICYYQTNGIYWRRVKLTDLPKLKKMVNKESRELFGVLDIARIMYVQYICVCVYFSLVI